MARFGHCDICDKFGQLSFAVVCQIETHYCTACEWEAPTWAARIKYWRRNTLPDIPPTGVLSYEQIQDI